MSVLGVVLARSYLRHGNYKRSPARRNDDEWFETPEWLKLLLMALYGFTGTSVAVVLVHFLSSHRPTPAIFEILGPISFVITLLFFLIGNANPTRERTIWRTSLLVVAIGLGTMLALFLYGSFPVN